MKRLSRRQLVAIGIFAVVMLLVLTSLVRSRDSTKKSAAQSASPPPSEARTTSGMAGMTGMTTTENGSVKLTADQIRQFGVTFGTAEVRPLTTEVRTAGVVTFNETRIAQVSARFGGFAERLYVDFTGKPVRRGQPLLEIFSPDLVAAQQELLLAGQLQRDIGSSSVPGVPASANLVAAARRRLELWDISDAQINQILRTRRVRRTLTLYAPVSGVVVEKKVVQGQAVMAGEQLYTIVDLSSVWIEAELREADAPSVRVGSPADIEFVGLPGRPLKGLVQYVYPTLQQEARTLKVRILVQNPGGILKPGMYATVRINTPGRSTLTVPNTAILRTGDRSVVFVDMGKGELMPHEVELGRGAGDYTEILTGLVVGQRVVTSAQFLLDSESNLGEVMKSMIGNMGSGDKASKSVNEMPGMKMSPTKR